MSSPDNNESRKRAVIYFAWGKKFVLQATTSARSARLIGERIVLITDSNSAKHLIDKTAFDEVKLIELRYGNKLDKCTLWEHLPGGYDSFLLLDTDTLVLGDLSFGFEQAEKHGIAMAPAPNYNLGHHWGFRHAMPSMGLVDRAQLQLNTGVLFFSKREDVERVFMDWQRLAGQFTDNEHVASDQPLFTAAMELQDFNPYTLSQSYNYRGLGELAVGPIHVWHSHHKLPMNLNKDLAAWPPRRFIGDKEVPYITASRTRRMARFLRKLFKSG